MSQFWYDAETTERLTQEVLKLAEIHINENNNNDGVDDDDNKTKFTIACVSCPTLFKRLHEILRDRCLINKSYLDNIEIKLFEYDRRFEKLYNNTNGDSENNLENFIFYDYNKPLEMNIKYKNKFNLVIADPPYIAEECMLKTCMTIRYLLINSTNSKIIVCTGELMNDLLNKCLNMKQCINFEPKHARNLANQFKCFANYNTYYL